MKKSFDVTFTYTVQVDDWIVIFQDSKGEIVAIWNTESWEQWENVGIFPYMQLSPKYIEERKQAVIDHAIELYKDSYK